MSYEPIAVANELIARYGTQGSIDPMKLQKLLYFGNGWWLAVNGMPLLSETPEVWRYGPVFPSIYRAFSSYGRSQIDAPLKAPFEEQPKRIPDPQNNNILAFLDWLWNEYGNRSGPALSDDTHRPGTPWRQIAERHNFVVPSHTVIPPEQDWKYFAELLRARGGHPANYVAP